MTRVAVFGAAGSMGSTTCGAIAATQDLELVAAIDPRSAGRRIGDLAPVTGSAADLVVQEGAEELDGESIDVAVDFTVRDAAFSNLAWCAANGVHGVCGTTGLSADDLVEIAHRFESDGGRAHAVVAANFSIGAVLMMRCAALCAPLFEAVEVIELHHDHKRDAPSGTSLATVARIEQARRSGGAAPLPADPTEVESLSGARGARSPGGVAVHSVRLPGLVAHQEVIFGSLGETLTIRHDSTERVSFMAGVLLAVRMVGDLEGVTVGLDALLGF